MAVQTASDYLVAAINELYAAFHENPWGTVTKTTNSFGVPVSPLSVAVSVFVLVSTLAYLWGRRRGKRVHASRLQRAAPLQQFLTVLSANDFNSRRFFSMFDHRVFRSVERGMLRAMARCVKAELGNFQRLDVPSIRFEAPREFKGDSSAEAAGSSTFRFGVSALADFEKMKNVECSLEWITSASHATRVTTFKVKPTVGFLDALGHIVPDEFEQTGELFVRGMLTRSPDAAKAMMAPSLAKKYPTTEAIVAEMMKVVRAIGGLKDRQLSPEMIDARLTRLGGSSSREDLSKDADGETLQKQGPRIVELDFLVHGNTRDVKVTVCFMFQGFKALVVRFSFVALPVTQKHVVLDQDADGGRKVVAST